MNLKKTAIYLLSAILLIGGVVFIWQWMPSKAKFRQSNFARLPNWKSSKIKQSLLAFQASCQAFINQNPEQEVGTSLIDLQVKDWLPACNEALKLPVTEESSKLFFEKWFVPIEFYDNKPVSGLFTGYYMPTLKGSLKKTKEFSTPLYGVPSDLVSANLELFLPKSKNKLFGHVIQAKMLPYYTREQIDKGAIKDKAQILVWINSPIDRVFLEIEGSGIIELPDGKSFYIGYAAQNGLPYTSIGGVLIKEGVFNKDTASTPAIKQYLASHPEKIEWVLHQNKSFVFFRRLSLEGAYGSQGVPLSPGYSLAIDKKWIPMGMPLWLTTTRPDTRNINHNEPLNRLMIAQDTGGAIRGKVRGDVFWGAGDKANLIAGHMRNEGHYWLLIPRHALSRLNKHLMH